MTDAIDQGSTQQSTPMSNQGTHSSKQAAGSKSGVGMPRKTGISNRGFASMDAAKQRAIASKGGQAAHAQGKAHEFSSEEARIAGRKGGQAAHARGTAHQFSSEEARRAGHKSRQRHQRASAENAAPTVNRYESNANRFDRKTEQLLSTEH
jgi:general stress protein YciG